MSTARVPSPIPNRGDGPSDRSSQFYSREAFLVEGISEFIGTALAEGASAVVIATRPHIETLARSLRARGLDLARVAREGRYFTLEATEVLSRFVQDGHLDRVRFSEVVGGVVERAAASSRHRDRRVVAFGEMVALLSAEGKAEVALELGQMWNELTRSHAFSLRCAHPMAEFDGSEHADTFPQIFEGHSKATPAAGRSDLASREEDSPGAKEREQPAKASTSQAELRRRDERFKSFVESAQDYAVFMLDSEGHITNWNAGAEDIKGYEAEEILGRHFSCLYRHEDIESGKPERFLTQAIRQGKAEEEGWRVRSNGTSFWARVSLTAIRDQEGALLGFGNVIRDLTERLRSESAMHRHQERFQMFVEAVRDYAMFILDPLGFVVTWNSGAERIKGYRASEIIGRHFSVFYPEEDLEAKKPEYDLEMAAREGRYETEEWRLRKDGSKFWAGVVITALRDETGTLSGFGKVTRDLTERKAAEEELLNTEERFRLMVEAVQDYAIFMLDPQGHVMSWNLGAERIKQYRGPEIIGKHFSIFYPHEDVDRGKPGWELQVAAKIGRFEDEGWRIRKDGTRFWANVIITAIRDEKGKLTGFGKVTRDVTERMLTERSLEASQRKLYESERSLRELSLHLLRTQDEERRRIGREIHDSLGQYLSVLKMKIDSMASAGSQEAKECGALIEECVKEVRTISYLLYPPMLEEMGLKSAIPWYLQGFSKRSGIKTTFEVPDELERLPRDTELVLFRVLQESLTNVQRHSGSETAEVRILRDKDCVTLCVADHGKGVPPPVLEQGSKDWMGSLGVGLRGMSERLRQLGGTLEISSNENGTEVRANVPIPS